MRRGRWKMLCSLFFICCWIDNVKLTVQGACRKLEFTPQLKGHALINHVIKNITPARQDTCEVACYLDNHCLSYNFGRRKDGENICQLSDSSHLGHPEDLQTREGFTYRGTVNDCSSNPCSRNGNCVIDGEGNTYRCICNAGYEGRNCEIGNWKKININPVCFGARDDSYGLFKIKKKGRISTFKLVHRSGFLRCNVAYPGSYWGCTNQYLRGFLLTVITFPNNTPLPIAEYVNAPDGCGKYHYHLDGFGVNSSELVFNHLPFPMKVYEGQKFKIWNGLDLLDCNEKNNDGQTCADVYGLYN